MGRVAYPAGSMGLESDGATIATGDMMPIFSTGEVSFAATIFLVPVDRK